MQHINITSELFQSVYDSLYCYGSPGHERITLDNYQLPYTTKFNLFHNFLYYIKRLFCCGGDHPHERVGKVAQPVLRFFQKNKELLKKQHYLGIVKLSHLSVKTELGFKQLAAGILQQEEVVFNDLKKKKSTLLVQSEELVSSRKNEEALNKSKEKKLELSIKSLEFIKPGLQTEISSLQNAKQQLIDRQKKNFKEQEIRFFKEKECIESLKEETNFLLSKTKIAEDELVKLKTKKHPSISELEAVLLEKEKLEKEIGKINSNEELLRKVRRIEKELLLGHIEKKSLRQSEDERRALKIQEKKSEILKKEQEIHKVSFHLLKRIKESRLLKSEDGKCVIDHVIINQIGMEALQIEKNFKNDLEEKKKIEAEIKLLMSEYKSKKPVIIQCFDGLFNEGLDFCMLFPQILLLDDGKYKECFHINLTTYELYKGFSEKTIRLYFKCIQNSNLIKTLREEEIFQIFNIAEVFKSKLNQKIYHLFFERLIEINGSEEEFFKQLFLKKQIVFLWPNHFLMQKAYKWISAHLTEVISNPITFNFSYEEIIAILQQEMIRVNSEKDLFSWILKVLSVPRDKIIQLLEGYSLKTHSSIVDFINFCEFKDDFKKELKSLYSIDSERIAMWEKRLVLKNIAFRLYANLVNIRTKEIAGYAEKTIEVDIYFPMNLMKEAFKNAFFLMPEHAENQMKFQFLLHENYERDGVTYRQLEVILLNNEKKKKTYTFKNTSIEGKNPSFAQVTAFPDAYKLIIVFPISTWEEILAKNIDWVQLKLQVCILSTPSHLN